MPKLIMGIENCSESKASIYGGYLLTVYALTQFVFSPLIGNLSDKYGRRPILLFSLLGFGLDYILLSFAPSLLWLYIGRVIAGITGASFTTASAFIADISTSENRAKNFGLVGAAFGLGFIIGPVIGGVLGSFGERVPFQAAAVLCFLNMIYGYFVMPESLKPENRRAFDWGRINPIKNLIAIKNYPKISGLFLALFLLSIGHHAVHSNWSYYTNYQFQWTEKMIGISLGIVGILVGVVQGGLVRVINPKIGNKKSIVIGILFYTIGLTLFAFAINQYLLLLFLIPYCLGGLSGPAMQAYITENVPDNEQGEIQGTITSIMSLTSIVGPIIMSNVFYEFTFDTKNKIHQPIIEFAGAPFVLGAALCMMSFLIVYYSFKKLKSVSSS